MTTRDVHTNGIVLRVTEQGTGYPVVLCHGFPELAYSWRHQVPALAEAGYHAIAPDQRGYGGSSRPADIASYDLDTLAADVVGILDHYGVPRHRPRADDRWRADAAHVGAPLADGTPDRTRTHWMLSYLPVELADERGA